MFDDKKIILASRSPRRQIILTEAGIDFIVKPVEVSEDYHNMLPAEDVAKFLAEKKARQFPFLKDNEVVITADTTVIINGAILGKPVNASQAVTMLSSLSGKIHDVITGVCIKSKDKVISFDDDTRVYFRTLTDKEIDYYVGNFKPFDKAGAYGIQEWIGMVGIRKIEGSYFNVMGLPIHKVYSALLSF